MLLSSPDLREAQRLGTAGGEAPLTLEDQAVVPGDADSS
jgi:hypothetical protein